MAIRLKKEAIQPDEINEIKVRLRGIKGRNIEEKVRALAREVRRPVELVRRIARDY
jgi:predicted transcriptional regulator